MIIFLLPIQSLLHDHLADALALRAVSKALRILTAAHYSLPRQIPLVLAVLVLDGDLPTKSVIIGIQNSRLFQRSNANLGRHEAWQVRRRHDIRLQVVIE